MAAGNTCLLYQYIKLDFGVCLRAMKWAWLYGLTCRVQNHHMHFNSWTFNTSAVSLLIVGKQYTTTQLDLYLIIYLNKRDWKNTWLSVEDVFCDHGQNLFLLLWNDIFIFLQDGTTHMLPIHNHSCFHVFSHFLVEFIQKLQVCCWQQNTFIDT